MSLKQDKDEHEHKHESKSEHDHDHAHAKAIEQSRSEDAMQIDVKSKDKYKLSEPVYCSACAKPIGHESSDETPEEHFKAYPSHKQMHPDGKLRAGYTLVSHAKS